jgi:hypothetical protein
MSNRCCPAYRQLIEKHRIPSAEPSVSVACSQSFSLKFFRITLTSPRNRACIQNFPGTYTRRSLWQPASLQPTDQHRP